MLKPWDFVYGETHLNKKWRWRPSTVPLRDFFAKEVLQVHATFVGKVAAISFTRKHKYRVWREWLPFITKPITCHVATVSFFSHVSYRPEDTIPRITKSFEVVLHDYEVTILENNDFTELPESFMTRVSSRLENHVRHAN